MRNRSKTAHLAAGDLIPEIPAHSVTLVDRNFLCGRFIHRLMSKGIERHFVTRSKSKTLIYKVKELGPGDYLVQLNHSKADRKKDKTLPKCWVTIEQAYLRDSLQLGR